MSIRRQNPSSIGVGSSGSGTNSENVSKKRALNGLKNSFENIKNEAYLCPICLEIIAEAYITKCGKYLVTFSK